MPEGKKSGSQEPVVPRQPSRKKSIIGASYVELDKTGEMSPIDSKGRHKGRIFVGPKDHHFVVGPYIMGDIEFVRADTTTGLINQWVTSHAPVAQINEITSLARKVIGDNDKAKKWLSEPNIALDNKAPVNFLGDRQGYERVKTLLLRIEYGVLS